MGLHKIKEIKLSAVRGINYFVSPGVDIYGADANFVDMPQADTSKINVFAGPNGAGKSTFLDTVRVLGNADLLLTLRRSTLSAGLAYHSFRLLLDDGTVVNVEFEEKGSVSLKHLKDRYHESILDEAYPIIGEGKWDTKNKDNANNFFENLHIKVSFWAGQSSIEFDSKFISELSNLAPYLTGLDSIFPVVKDDQLPLEVIIYLTDEPNQSHQIQAHELPSGWKSAAGLLSWVSKQQDESVCVIEEPEIHLHPLLQRRVMHRLAELTIEKKLQIFVSTHSPVLLHPSSWKVSNEDLAIFHVDGKNVYRVDNTLVRHGKLLDDLGTKVSDLLQANCVIWIEGPSDRIYIRFWIEKWCEHTNSPTPIENFHYVFSFYGGSILSHFDASSPEEVTDFISMLRLNRRSLVIMDRDNDFKPCAACGTIIRTRITSPKYKMVDELKQLTWVTEGYTIEEYLPENYFNEGYLKINSIGSVEIGTKLSKVKLSKKYERDHRNSNFSILFGNLSPEKYITKIYNFIYEANHEL